MLHTNLDHLESTNEMKEALATHENVMICCGRMGPMCLPVYAIMEKLRESYPHVKFFDQDFDGPGSSIIRRLPECATFMGLPFTVYFRNSKPIAATSSLQDEQDITEILDREFS